MMSYVWLVPVVAVVSALLTGVIRRYAVRFGVLDHPNRRSAHSSPTPRGGGVAIAVAFLGSTLWLGATGAMAGSRASVVVVALTLTALVGFLDDHRSVAVHWRLLAHVIGASLTVWAVGGVGALAIGDSVVALGWAGHVLGVLALVWLLNLYNFMDGIDGLAGAEAVSVSVCAAAVSWYLLGGTHWLWPSLLGASASGFLVWNWPPARIFMGDAGSGFVGLALGALALNGAQHHPRLLWVWAILLGVFMVDATVTLLRRLVRSEKIIEAHTEHAYQHSARRHSHRAVTLAVLAINMCWLFPLALVVSTGWLSGPVGLLIAYVPLVILALREGAGAPVDAPIARRVV